MDSGSLWSGWRLTPHVAWYQGGRYTHWTDAHDWPNTQIGPSKVSYPLKKGYTAADIPKQQYSTHPSGLAVVTAPFLYAFRKSPYLESAAALLSGIVTIVGMLFFRLLIRPLVASESQAAWCTAITYLGTPLWHYGRTFFSEPYIATCFIGAYALSLRKSWHFTSGVLIGIATLIKPPALLLILPLLVVLFHKREYAAMLKTSIPCAVSAGMVLLLNHLLFGAWHHSPQPFVVGSPFAGLFTLTLSVNHGLIWFAPLTVGLCWSIRRIPLECWPCLAGAAIYIALMCLWHVPKGGYCYGPRLIVPVVPLILLAALMA